MAKRKILVRAMLLAALLWPAAARAEGLLETTVFRRDDITAFTKWTGMLARFSEALPSAEGDCTPSPLMPCPARDWRAFIDGLGGADLLTQIKAINARVNTAHYIEDMRNWGILDYWATPFEFMARDGDCEDYAIAKYLTLKAIGVDAARMRIVIVDDLNLDQPHAVLTIDTGGRVLVLDNQARDVADASAVRHYRAIYSINETSWWLHRSPD